MPRFMTRSIIGAFAVALGALMLPPVASAQAPIGAWCLNHSSRHGSGFVDCQWATFERCRREAQRNRAAHCSPNPQYQELQRSGKVKRKKSRRYREY